MDKDNIYIIILLIFVWTVGFTIAVISLYRQAGLIAILGISAPYYLTKYLLLEEDAD